jgi:predicted SAM-dependent methyltransferase
MKLHLGCGDRRLPDFINIDIRPTDAVDVLGDISKDLPYEKESIDLIYSCANIEHFGRKEWIEVVKYWFTLLKPKGVLRLSTADFEAVCHEYIKNKDITSLLGFVVGGQKNPYDWHGMIFDFNLLEKTLKEIGFTNVQRYDWRETEHSTIDDYSSACLPHMDKENGTLLMLNVEAIK